MGTIAKVTAGGSTHLVASTAYGTCPTAAATAAKVATIQDSQAFTLVTGVTVHIKMTYSNTVASATLNVNSTGAKPIYKHGSTSPGTDAGTSWKAGAVVSFTYDGTAWMMNDCDDNMGEINTELAKKAEATALQVTLSTSGWSNKAQTVTATGVTASNNVIVAPVPANMEAYAEAGIRCTAQAANSLTFACDTVPDAAISVNVLAIS